MVLVQANPRAPLARTRVAMPDFLTKPAGSGMPFLKTRRNPSFRWNRASAYWAPRLVAVLTAYLTRSSKTYNSRIWKIGLGGSCDKADGRTYLHISVLGSGELSLDW